MIKYIFFLFSNMQYFLNNKYIFFCKNHNKKVDTSVKINK